MFSGNLITWAGSSLSNSVKAHTGPCTSLTQRKKGKGIISGGKEGNIMIWNESLQNISIIKIGECVAGLT